MCCDLPPAFMLPPWACRDLHNIAFEQGPINKQLQDRKMYQAELLHDGEAFNFWFHSPLVSMGMQRGGGGQAWQKSFSQRQAHSPTSADTAPPTYTHMDTVQTKGFERPNIMASCHGSLFEVKVWISVKSLIHPEYLHSRKSFKRVIWTWSPGDSF